MLGRPVPSRGPPKLPSHFWIPVSFSPFRLAVSLPTRIRSSDSSHRLAIAPQASFISVVFLRQDARARPGSAVPCEHVHGPPELRARGSAAGSGWSPGRPGCARGPFDNCCRSKKTLFHAAPSLKSFSPNPHLKGSETSLGEGSLRTLGTDAWGSPKLDPPRAGRFHGNRG